MDARRSMFSRMVMVAAAVFAAACGGDSPIGPEVVPPPDDTGPDSVAASRVDGAARRLYEAVAQGGGGTPAVVREILGAVLPVADPATERARAESLLAAGEPLVPTFVVAAAAQAVNAGHLVDAGSYFQGAAAHGVRETDAGGAIDRFYFGTKLQSLVGREVFGRDELLPALVMALGRERAGRRGLSFVDPVWGDAGLDAVQLTLLDYALHYAGAATPPAGAARALVFDRVGQWADAPFTAQQAASAAICLPTTLFGYRAALGSPDQLGTRSGAPDGRGTGGLPSRGAVTALVTYESPVPDEAGWLLQRIGCHLPANGAARDLPLAAEVVGKLPGAGTLAVSRNGTDALGWWVSTFHAAEDDVPAWMRVRMRVDSGSVALRATALATGWQSLGMYFGIGPATPLAAHLRFSVRRYDLPRRLHFTMRVHYGWERGGEGVVASLDAVALGYLTLDEYGPVYRSAGRDVGFEYAGAEWRLATPDGCQRSLGGYSGGYVLVTAALQARGPETPEGITLDFPRDARGELPRERFRNWCEMEGTDVNYFTKFWRLAHPRPISIEFEPTGGRWSNPEPGWLTTNFGIGSNDGSEENPWGEWIFLDLRAVP